MEQERRALRSQLLLLEESREAVEAELQSRARALAHGAEELELQRANNSTLRWARPPLITAVSPWLQYRQRCVTVVIVASLECYHSYGSTTTLSPR